MEPDPDQVAQIAAALKEHPEIADRVRELQDEHLAAETSGKAEPEAT